MQELILRAVDLLTGWTAALLPWTILGDDEIGLVRRLGKYSRDLRPGVNLKIPIIEETISDSMALESVMLQEQTLTTADGDTVTVRGSLSYRVTDAKAYLLECGEVDGLLSDIVCCVIAEQVPDLATVDILGGDVSAVLFEPMRQRALKWGVEIVDVGLVERTRTRAYRLLQG